MKEYLRILQNVLNGTPKQPTRMVNGVAENVENGTIGTFCEVFRHNMSEGFPLLTTKKVSIKNIAVELEGFIKGVTSKKWYQDRGCHIWDAWCNPSEIPLGLTLEERKQFQLKENDLGKLYGAQWRKFDEQYGEIPTYINELGWKETDFSLMNGVFEGFDQLKYIADTLRTNPYDRRMVCSAWNPNQFNIMALPPCHYSFNVVVYGNKLNLSVQMRSGDSLLGIPYNIASYALLLLILAKHANLESGELVLTINDCHLYNNHLDQAKLQLTREPYPLPTLEVLSDDIFEWDHTKIKLSNYQFHPAIKAEVTI